MENLNTPTAVNTIQRERRGASRRGTSSRSSKRTSSQRYDSRSRYTQTSTHGDDDDNETMIDSVLLQPQNGLHQRRRDYAPLKGDDLINNEFHQTPAPFPAPVSIFQLPHLNNWIWRLCYLLIGAMLYLSFSTSGSNHRSMFDSSEEADKLLTSLGRRPRKKYERNNKFAFKLSPPSLRGSDDKKVLTRFNNNDDMVVNPKDASPFVPNSGPANVHDDYIDLDNKLINAIENEIVKQKEKDIINPKVSNISASTNTAIALKPEDTGDVKPVLAIEKETDLESANAITNNEKVATHPEITNNFVAKKTMDVATEEVAPEKQMVMKNPIIITDTQVAPRSIDQSTKSDVTNSTTASINRDESPPVAQEAPAPINTPNAKNTAAPIGAQAVSGSIDQSTKSDVTNSTTAPIKIDNSPPVAQEGPIPINTPDVQNTAASSDARVVPGSIDQSTKINVTNSTTAPIKIDDSPPVAQEVPVPQNTAATNDAQAVSVSIDQSNKSDGGNTNANETNSTAVDATKEEGVPKSVEQNATNNQAHNPDVAHNEALSVTNSGAQKPAVLPNDSKVVPGSIGQDTSNIGVDTSAASNHANNVLPVSNAKNIIANKPDEKSIAVANEIETTTMEENASAANNHGNHGNHAAGAVKQEASSVQKPDMHNPVTVTEASTA